VKVDDISKGPHPHHHPFLLLSDEEIQANPNLRESLLQGVLEKTPSKSLVSRQRTVSIDETREYLQQGLPISHNIAGYETGDYSSIVRGRSSSFAGLEMVVEEEEEDVDVSEPILAGDVSFTPYVPKMGYAAALLGQTNNNTSNPLPGTGSSSQSSKHQQEQQGSQQPPTTKKSKNKRKKKKSSQQSPQQEEENKEQQVQQVQTSSSQEQEQEASQHQESKESVEGNSSTSTASDETQQEKEDSPSSAGKSFADILKNKA
jgi:flagellar biosynthesis GTPase FlhF